MTVHLLAFSGLQLDRAWPEESQGVARLLREASAGLLLELVQRSLDLKVDGIAVLGGLWDPTTVRSSTVDDVRTAFGAILVPVIVLPDVAEAETAFRPHTLTDWPDTVHWVGGDAGLTIGIAGGRLIAQGPRGYGVPQIDEALALLTTRSSGPDVACPVLRPADAPEPGAGDLVPGGDVANDVQGFTPLVPPLVPGSGGGRPTASLLVLEPGAPPRVESVRFASDLGTTRRLDIGEHADSGSLTAALDEIVTSCGPLDRIEVSGRVGPRVLVPPALRWEPARRDVTVVWQDLQHLFPDAPQDRTVQAELIRRLSGPGPALARRHQALALALASLDSQEVSA